MRNIAERYRVSPTALFRHKQAHLPEKLALAKQSQGTLSAESLLAEMRSLKDRLWSGLEQAEKAANPAAFVAFAREFRQCLESYFQISERVAERARVNGDVKIEVVYSAGIGTQERQRIADLYGLDIARVLPGDNGTRPVKH